MINVPVVIEPERVPETVKKKLTDDKELWVVNPLRQEQPNELYSPPILLKGTFNRIPAKILVDSGSSGNFVSKSFVKGKKVETWLFEITDEEENSSRKRIV
jgi:hypothetical protein